MAVEAKGIPTNGLEPGFMYTDIPWTGTKQMRYVGSFFFPSFFSYGTQTTHARSSMQSSKRSGTINLMAACVKEIDKRKFTITTPSRIYTLQAKTKVTSHS